MSLTKRAVAAGVGGATPTSSRAVSLSQKKRGITAGEHHAKGTDAKVSLDRVLGITCHSPSALSASDSIIAYPAGCVAVLFHPKKRKRVHVRNKKPVSCLCVSPNGNYLATGERGHEPCVRVWDISSDRPTQVVQLKGHNFGVACVLFSPNQKNLVSIGYQHDRQILVWNWKNGTRVVHGKFSSPVNSAAFSHNHGNKLGGNYFVTVHHRRVQYWYYHTTGKDSKKVVKPVLTSRSVLLGDLQENHFVSVVCGKGPLSKNCYVLTRSGQLCLFDDKRRLDRFTEVKASQAHSLALSDQYLFCGCSEGVVRIFDPYTLDYVITMPLPHTLGVNVAAPAESSSSLDNREEKYPDSIAMTVLDHKIGVVYNDHSFYLWDLSNIKQIGKTHSFLYHSACVWDICVYPSLRDERSHLLPASCFVTCSSDNTIRFWCLDSEGAWSIKNHYSKELVRVLYSDPMDPSCLKDASSSPGDASAVADTTRGVRCIQIHPSGQHIATGDRLGNIKVYDLQFMDKIYDEVAHDSEILSLTYSPEVEGDQFLASASRDRMVHIFQCPPGQVDYQHAQSLPDHSAAVTALKFAPSKDSSGLQLLSSGADKSVIFHSLERDGDPLFQRSNHIVGKATIYDMDVDPAGKHIFTAGQDKFLRVYLVSSGKQRLAIKAPTSDDGSLIKVSLDPSGLYAAASSADKSVVLFDIFSGECVTKLYGHSEVVTQIAFSQDCKYLYTVSGDSCVFVWRLSREITQNMHERLLEMGRSLPSSSQSPSTAVARATYTKAGDKERETFTVERVSEGGTTAQGELTEREGRDTPDSTRQQDVGCSSDSDELKLRLSLLPPWAQKQMLSRPSVAQSVSSATAATSSASGGGGRGGAQPHPPATAADTGETAAPLEGKWAQRMETGFMFASQESTDSETEIEDLSMEMSKVVSEQAFDVIDSTEDDTHSESPDISDIEEVLYLESKQTDIDPHLFSVTTPTRPVLRQFSEPEGESGDEVDAVSPESSPPLDKDRDREYSVEEALFLKKNFESLEKSEGLFLNVPNPRLSISAKFLERNMRRHLLETEGHEQLLASCGSPDLIEAAGIVVTVQDVNNKGAHSSGPGDREGSFSGAQAVGGQPDNSDAPIDSHSLEPCTLAMSDSEAEPGSATETVDPSVSESMAEDGSGSSVQPACGDEKLSDSEKQQQQKEEDSPEASLVEKIPGKRPAHIERCSSLDDIKLTKQKISSKRRPSFEEDISKTRRRLEKLGYLSTSAEKTREGGGGGGKEGGTGGEPQPSVGSRKSARIRLRGKQTEAKSTASDEATVSVEANPQLPQEVEGSSEVHDIIEQPATADKVEEGPDGLTAASEAPDGLTAASEEPDGLTAASHSPTSDSLSDTVKQLLQVLEEKMRELVTINDQMIERVSEEAPEENSTHKEIIRTIASGINSFKTQLVSVTNKNKKMWRAVARSGSEPVISSTLSRGQVELEGESSGTPGRYNLRMTPTRQAVAGRYRKQTTAKGEQEGGGGGSSNNEDDVTSDVTSHPISKTDKSDEVEMEGKATVDSELVETSRTEDAAAETIEPSTLEHAATVTVPVTELERAKEMAQQLTALIANLECQESGFSLTSSECV